MNIFFDNKCFILFMLGLILISCSTDQKNESAPIQIKEISAIQVINRAPKENDFQNEIELAGLVSDENLKQDIQYKWYVEYLKLDIEDTLKTDSDSSSDIQKNRTFLDGVYFLDVSKNPLNALLSIYKPGFFKITLQASNIKETRTQSMILKIGNPDLPELFLKVNIPKIDKSRSEDFKGGFYFTYNNSKSKLNLNNIDIIQVVKAEKMMDKWYNTSYSIDPYLSFNIQSGTHVLIENKLDNKNIYLLSLNKNDSPLDYKGINYSLNAEEQKSIDIIPIILKNLNNKNFFKISNLDNYTWDKGNIFISFLTWGINDKGKDEFIFSEEQFNNEKKELIKEIDNKYLCKVFVGSYGHRVVPNKYFVYFGPSGSNADELDQNCNREFPGLPYGYLLGKLGVDGTPFPIGNNFSYIHKNLSKIYSVDSNMKYVQDKVYNNNVGNSK